MKKILLSIVALIIISVSALFILNGKDTYSTHQSIVTLSDGLNVGSKIDYQLPDQFGNSNKLDDSIQTLILVFAKDTGHTVKEYLATKNKDYLTKHHATFVADISPMPVVIRNTFAIPDLITQPYSVNIILDKKLATSLKNEAKADLITIVTLKNKQVQKVAFIESVNELKKMIEKY